MTMQNADLESALIAAHQALKQRLPIEGGGKRMGVLPETISPPSSARRQRSLQCCHRYAMAERLRKPAPRNGNAYVPELAARIEDDPNLTDGARRCGRKIAELTYRQNREGRSLAVTVTYLARALGRCRRTVQRYLRQLEREGYIAVDVVASQHSRMCVGLVVRLMTPLFAAHHRARWPGSLAKPGATLESQKQRSKDYSQVEGARIPVGHWALRCMEGVFRSLMKTNPFAGLPPVVPG